jgi:hypothetical protein
VMGTWEIVIAFEVRKLAQRLRGVRPIPAS